MTTTTTFPQEVIVYTLLIAASGGFGGFVHGILRREDEVRKYSIAFPVFEFRLDLGFLGDILVGIAAGVSIFMIIESFFGITIQGTINTQQLLKLLALGVISGYTGSGLLDTLSMALSKRLAQSGAEALKADKCLEEARNELEKFKEQSREELEELKEHTDTALRARRLIQVANAYKRWEKYDRAEAVYESAIKVAPKIADPYISKCYLYADQAKKESDPSLNKALNKDAIELCNRALDVDKKSYRAYYNRAWLQQRLGSLKEEVLADLKQAIQLNPDLKELAAHDPDFEKLRADADFRSVVK